jgi:glycosyltransferase involved in cell wall biosynthesis
LGKQAELKGYDVRYLFSHAYAWMLPPSIKEKTWFIGNSTGIVSSIGDGLSLKTRSKLMKLLKNDPPDYIYCYNFHPFLNYFVASLAKKHGCTFIQHVQEPYVEDKRVYRGMQQYWLRGFEYLQERLLKITDIAIVSSERSRQLFQKRYPDFSGRLMTIPLMYEDQGNVPQNIEKRHFITFIGPPAPAKGTEIFLNVVKYAHEYQYPFEFLLISRKKIEDRRFYKYPNLHIVYNEKISDEDMREYLLESQMVITPYLVATQSSVVLTSFMFGTPALSSNVGGLPEFIEHGKTGYLTDPAAKTEEWVKGVEYITEHLYEMSHNCRNHFKENFSENNWPKYFHMLLTKQENNVNY